MEGHPGLFPGQRLDQDPVGQPERAPGRFHRQPHGQRVLLGVLAGQLGQPSPGGPPERRVSQPVPGHRVRGAADPHRGQHARAQQPVPAQQVAGSRRPRPAAQAGGGRGGGTAPLQLRRDHVQHGRAQNEQAGRPGVAQQDPVPHVQGQLFAQGEPGQHHATGTGWYRVIGVPSGPSLRRSAQHPDPGRGPGRADVHG